MTAGERGSGSRSSWSSGFLDLVDLPRGRGLDGLNRPGGPSDDGLLDPRRLAQAEVEATLVLGRVPTAAADFLQLLLSVPAEPDLGTDGASVGPRPVQLEIDPLAIGRHRVLVDQKRSPLVG